MTNYEKIKTMDINEMAESLDIWCHCVGCPAKEVCDWLYPKEPTQTACARYLKLWLESEVDSND